MPTVLKMWVSHCTARRWQRINAEKLSRYPQAIELAQNRVQVFCFAKNLYINVCWVHSDGFGYFKQDNLGVVYPLSRGDNLRAFVIIVFLSYRGVIEVDISEYHTASVLVNYLDFNFILQGNIMMYHTSNYSMLSSSVL